MRIKRLSYALAVAAATGCQAIWGDFRVDESQLPREPEPDLCTESGSYRCDDATLLLCLDAGTAWTTLLSCEAGQECSAERGRCVSPGISEGSGGAGGATSSGGAPSVASGGKASTGGAAPAAGGSGGTSTTPGDAGSSQGGEPTLTGGTSSGGGAAGGACGSDGCDDACPEDPQKTAPGACGCGVADNLECAVLRAALAQRYSFDGTGDVVLNSASAEHGVAVNAMLSGTGALDLAGTTSDQYVDLPNGLASSLVNATFETWLTWRGGAAWQRVFDFGSNQNAEGSQGTGATYLFLTPMAANTSGFTRVAFSTVGTAAETKIDAPRALTVGAVSHVAVVVDDDKNLISLYLDGALQGSVAFASQLSLIKDVNVWLGRSQFAQDPELNATFDEFRIYRAALSAAQVAASFQAGPNPAFLVR